MATAGFCGQCGSPLASGGQYCHGCGSAVVAASPSSPTQAAGAQPPVSPPHHPRQVTLGRSTNPLACPHCREIDASRKVTAVHAEGATTGRIGGSATGVGYQFGRYGGSSVSFTGFSATTASQSNTSRVLSPPAQPVYRSPWAWGAIGGGLCGLIALSSLSSSVVAFLFFGALAALIIYMAARTAKRRKEEYARAFPLWQRAMDIRDRLYYCQRCDGIYLPGRPELYRTTDLMNVLYQV